MLQTPEQLRYDRRGRILIPMLTQACAVCFCLLVLPTLRAHADEKALDGIDAFVGAARDHWEVPGLSIAVVKDGKVVFAEGSRWITVAENWSCTDEPGEPSLRWSPKRILASSCCRILTGMG
jgi:hypothetical protein